MVPTTPRHRRKHHKTTTTQTKKIFQTIQHTGKKVLPQVNSGLQYVGTKVKSAAPIVEKGISNVYGTLATGFDMGAKGIKNIVSSKRKRPRHTQRTKYTRRHRTRRYH